MIHSRLFGPRILRVPLATALVISAVLGAGDRVGPGSTSGPVPASKLSEAERARQLAERDGTEQEVIKLARPAKLEEAVTAAVKELAIEREVLGELHEDVVGSLEFLARMHECDEDWAAARKALTEVLAIRQRQPDRKDWRIGDARRALADLDCARAMTPRPASEAAGSGSTELAP